MTALIGIHDKLHGDLLYARSEIAWGHLDSLDLDRIFVLPTFDFAAASRNEYASRHFQISRSGMESSG
jgi:hypothetical protein